MRSSLKLRLIPIYVALAIMLAPLGMRVIKNHHIAASASAAQTRLTTPRPAAISGIPNRILIPSLSIDLPVVKGSLNPTTHTWSVSPAQANYAINTAPANNYRGQTMIYGHNNSHVFGPLLNLKSGAIAYVYTDNNHLFKYKYVASQDISPQANDLFDQMAKAQPGLKLITCDGAYFQYRHLMSFELIKAI